MSDLFSSGAKGFTLVEILVALVIMSITTDLIAVKIAPSPNQSLQYESTKLATLLDKARDEALLSGADMALTLSGTTYTFEKKTLKGWESLNGDDLFHPRNMDTAVSTADMQLDNKATRLVLDHSGWATPGKITLHGENSIATVHVNLLGVTTTKPPHT